MTNLYLRSRLMIFCCVATVVAMRPAFGEDSTRGDRQLDAMFQKEVLPILKQHCYECHSHEANEANGGLVLDSRSGWSVGGDSGPAIIPRRPDESLLVKAIRHTDQELAMPPSDKLPAEAIARLERWVAAGAYDPRVTSTVRTTAGINYEQGRQHWAFLPVQDSDPPAVRDAHWPLSAVDQFVLAQLESHGLSPNSDADRYSWLRRVSFDLTGLPPTPAEIAVFVEDSSANAYEKVVDRLLDSRAFGERWARHWLDLVGYADQTGTSNSVFAEHAWRYRDYLIDAFNNDKPFDRFAREQIAGDLLPYKTVEERARNLIATGFLVLGDIEIVEADKDQLLVNIVDQQVAKTGKAFLAMTIDCARCHDHKFDPISQRDYYALGGFFHNTSSVYKTDRGVWSDVNVHDLPETRDQQAEREQRVKHHQAQLAELEAQLKTAEAERTSLDERLQDQGLSADDRRKLREERAGLASRANELNREIAHSRFFAPTVPKAHGVRDVAEPQDMRITIRGNARALGDTVPRGFLTVVSTELPDVAPNESGRRELADWIVSSENPLSARVAVNRIWQRLFGVGLVPSVDYFGLPGEKPSHPKLLDYLASQFVREGWSQKRLIRSLALSRVYRLDSRHDSVSHAQDPENRMLWRMNRFRLDAEAIRDAMIFVSGKLVPSQGGPAMPLEYPENVGGIDPKDVNPPNFRLNRWRPQQEFERTVYLPIVRHSGQPGPASIRNVFDFPQPSQFTGRRSTTAVPTQALFLMNSPVVKKHAAALASQLNQRHEDPVQRLRQLWLTTLGRPITGEEQGQSQSFLTANHEDGWIELCRALLASNEFLMRL